LDIDGDAFAVDEDSPNKRANALKAFLLNYRFRNAMDCGPNGDELPPLHCAAAEGSATVVRALIEARADTNQAYCGRTAVPYLGILPGVQPLHLAVGFCASQGAVHALLAHGADPNATVGDVALTPLAAGAYEDSADGIRALHQACNELNLTLQVEKGLEKFASSPLALAALSGGPETVRALVEIGCDRGAVGGNGYSVFRSACENTRMDLQTLELFWQNGTGADVNETAQPRTPLWHGLMVMSELVVRYGGALSGIAVWAKPLADIRGSTPLHGAARVGRLDIVEWMIDHGAVRSLRAKTTSGMTPLKLAERGGHYAIAGHLKEIMMHDV
jgi:ankyrin repeat protein